MLRVFFSIANRAVIISDTFMFRVIAKDKKSKARVGELTTPHGIVHTPAYVIVGTHAKVRAVRSEDLRRANTQIVIANTYHLWRTLGDEELKTYEGLHGAMGWDGPIMTDSGGFQVFSFGASREEGVGKVARALSDKYALDENAVRITDDGVWFRDREEECYLDAEKSIKIQEQLGADIIVAFDECTSPSHDYEYNKEANRRTHAWAERSLEARTRRDQLILGVVQGGVFEDLRRESAKAIGAMPFDGFAIGGAFGSSFGSGKTDTFRELDWVIPYLPEDRHRHLLGIGKIDDLFECVARGIDMFDCVIPTREARHGSIWMRGERLDITRGRHSDDTNALDPWCACYTCRELKTTRGGLHRLFKTKNPEAGRLATIHNIYFFNDLMEKIRIAISDDQFEKLRRYYLSS